MVRQIPCCGVLRPVPGPAGEYHPVKMVLLLDALDAGTVPILTIFKPDGFKK